jgi:dihydrofolate reductase
MRELISYMFTSLDGFIADRTGGLDWAPIDDELMRFANEYFATMDGIVFGRNVYQGFVEYWDHLDPGTASVLEVDFGRIFRDMTRIVVSTSLSEVDPKAVLVADDVAGSIAAIKERPGRDLLLICGPELRTALTRAGLVDRHRVLVAPVVLGDGVPLFAAVETPLPLRRTGTREFGGGVVMLDYED